MSNIKKINDLSQKTAIIIPDMDLIVCIQGPLKDAKALIAQHFGKLVADRQATMPFYYNPRYSVGANGLINLAYKLNAILYEKNEKKNWRDKEAVTLSALVRFDHLYSALIIGGPSINDLDDENIASYTRAEHELNLPLNCLGLDQTPSFTLREWEVLPSQVIQMKDQGKLILEVVFS